ncbi:MAG: DNA (cytosine-5-)-methyltransferase, partial [Porticoccus sp.]|nr:DNA (cytosine-5-)-methyltransferase [Porticoccus sp.]
GFPQVVSDTQAYRQFGNSVVPYLIEDIAKNILKIM